MLFPQMFKGRRRILPEKEKEKKGIKSLVFMLDETLAILP
jgi:hypothetical protein